MLARKVEDWKRSFEESTIPQIAAEHDCSEDFIVRVKTIIEREQLDDDVLILIEDEDSWDCGNGWMRASQEDA